ncbi:uncharacterized protein LOC126790722 [Argentina anserina]|uniref:uncharacterized protein LOC126790722 n=1 Tax=Argentina anserina TaxID=57926 RepID=UPI00217675C5|nr:uncharacterized protein LOC126790722 [Potentilla anserina]XP_050373025.1 uncharacterized protein LOC126790722 [Potentilla anserina]
MEGGESNSGGSSSAEGPSVLNRIMSKYRPIVPKPFTGGSLTNKLPKRTKRKYVRRNKEEHSGKHEMTSEQCVETLQLMEKSGSSGNESSMRGGGSSFEVDARVVEDNNHWLSLSVAGDLTAAMGRKQFESVSDPSTVMDRMGGVESWVTVECVRGSCMTAPTSSQGFEFGLSGVSADEERMRRLESDVCPGFISDGWNRVQWLNGAFKRMVMMTRQQQPLPEVTVWLSMTEELPLTTNSAFTCQVKLKYTVVESQKKDKNYYSQLVPCDLWRMDAGGFAWRLDVKAALTLGV